MDEFSLNKSDVKRLQLLCGLKDIRLHTTSMSVSWGRNAIVPSISICNRRYSWIIVRGESIYSHKYRHEVNIVTVAQKKAPESVQYIKHERGFQMMDRNLSEIDFERPYELKNISILNFTDKLLDGESMSYDGALVFTLLDSRQFSLASYSAPGALLEFSTEASRINWLLDNAIVRQVISK